MLARENKKRNKETRDETYDDVYIQKEKEDGTKVEQRVDKVRATAYFLPSSLFLLDRLALLWVPLLTGFAFCSILQAFLDLTDIQNRDFRYIL
jgi:hypothetical protein